MDELSISSKIGFQVTNSGSMSEIASFGVTQNSSGEMKLGNTTPLLLTNGLLQPAITSTFTIGNSTAGDIAIIGAKSTANCLKLYVNDNSGSSLASINIGAAINGLQTSGTRHYVNFDAGFSIGKKHPVDLGFSIFNILNTSYRDYLNRFRYFSDEQGRSIAIRINVPFDF
jgi:outer membrane receptor protein involved in Fe transport